MYHFTTEQKEERGFYYASIYEDNYECRIYCQ
jgi:hypothetical protein